MQSISLVPSTAYNTSIYVANRKNCSGGSIILEDRITDYFLPVSDTVSVSVDTSLLHPVPNSSMQFTLIVNSIGNNVLNLSGFEMPQIQVWDGISVFTVQKGLGEAVWSIQMKSSDVRPEQLLKCYLKAFVPPYEGGVFNIFNIKLQEGYPDNIEYLMNDTAIGQTTTRTYGKTSDASAGYICSKFPMPVWLKTVSFSVPNSIDSNNCYPNNVQVFGSNDGVAWAQILNSELTNTASAVNICTCVTDNYYTLFKFKYSYPSGYSTHCLPGIAMSGFISALINTGAYSIATPSCTSLPLNGYNIEPNTSSMSSTSGNIYYLTQWSKYNAYSMDRGSSDTAWEYVFTFPEAIRTIGMMYMAGEGYGGDSSCITLFSLSYSDNKTDWTEYCRVDGTLDAWNQSLINSQVGTYFCDSVTAHKYFKISIYFKNPVNSQLVLKGLGFLQFQKGLYLTFESFVPKLSSNSQSGYMLVASNSSQGDAYKMFNHDLSDYGGGDISDGEWSLLVQLPQATIVRGIELVSPSVDYNKMPYAFSLQGSDDNDTWTNIKTYLLGSNYWTAAGQLGQWDTDNETAYRYYRFVVTATAEGNSVRIGEIGLSSYASFKSVDWYEDSYIVPVMTGSPQDGYVATASSYYSGHNPYYAFDRSTDGAHKWLSDGSTVSGSWLKIELPTAQTCNVFTIKAPAEGFQTRVPTEFKIQGSNDDSAWTDLVDVSGISWNSGESKSWNNSSTTAYQYYRILISANGGDSYISIGCFDLIDRTYHQEN